MKAMILCAGRGNRMRPLTDHTPKPLLEVAGKPLLQHHIEKLVAAGITELVINHAHLGSQIEAFVGDGSHFGARVRYSPEAEALETGGGVLQALELLGKEPFILINGDIWTDYPLANLAGRTLGLAHLVLVDNPTFNTTGDFDWEPQTGRIEARATAATQRLTFAGLSLLHPRLFAAQAPGNFPLAPLLRALAGTNAISGEHYAGGWSDVGTPERLQLLEARLLTNQREAKA